MRKILTIIALAAGVSVACGKGADLDTQVSNGKPLPATFSFQITGPASPVKTKTPQVSWQKLSGTKAYDLVIGATAACAVPYVQGYFDLTVPFQALTQLTDGTYYACVFARSAAQVATPAVNNGFEFTVSEGNVLAAPTSGIDPFAITSPAKVLGSATPTLRWEAAGGAFKYDVVVATDAACATAVASFADVQSTVQALVDPLPPDATYYACVTAKSLDGSRTRSATNNGYSFLVDLTPPGAFQVTGPQSPHRGPSPELVWTPSAGALAYDVLLDDEATCTAPQLQSFPGTAATIQTVGALQAGVYFVCVSAVDVAGNRISATNDGYSFAVVLDETPSVEPENPLGAFTITHPLREIADATPELLWTEAEGAATYDLTIATDAACKTTVTRLEGLATPAASLTTALTPNTTYYVCVTARAGAFTRGATNDGYGFHVDQAPPDPFMITGPASPIASSVPQISWESAEGGALYRLVVDSDSGCTAPFVQKYDRLTDTSQALSALSDGTYFVCVTASDPAQNARIATNTAYSFVVNTQTAIVPPNPLGAFAITAPGVVTGDTTPDVTWQASTGATRYDVAVGADAACGTVVTSVANVVGTTVTIASALSDGITYYLCVTAKDAGTGSRAATNSGAGFLVDTTAPGAFTITGPASPASTTTPQVSWSASVGAATYRLVLDSDVACGVPHLQVYDNLSSTSQTLSALGDGTYYACLVARDAAGNVATVTNNAFSFTVAAAPVVLPPNPLGAFSITGPSLPSTNTTPTLTWQVSAAATKYDAVIATDPACATVIRTFADVAANSVLVTPALATNATYYACVTAEDAASHALPASNQGFALVVDTLAPGAFTITGPATPTATSMPQVSWSAAAGASRYDVVVDDGPACTAPFVQSFAGVAGTSQPLTALGDGTYHVCITALDLADNVVAASNGPYAFVVATEGPVNPANPLGAFSITAPAPSTADTTPELTWQAAVAATKYDVMIASDASCATPVLTYANVAATSQTVGSALSNGTTYYACVTAEDAGVNSRAALNDGLPFTIDTSVPAAFSITGPATPVNTATPQVSWGAAIGAATYKMIVDSDGACAAPHLQVYDSLAGTSQTLSALGDATYFVCVTARDAAGNMTAATNDGYTFVVDAVPAAAPQNPLGTFVISGPSEPTTDTTPDLIWQPSTSATRYDVVVASDAACATVLRTFSDVAATFVTITAALPANATYYACVTAEDGSSNARIATNNGFAFNIDTTAPAAFSITGPATPASTSTPQASWQAAAGAARYELYIDVAGSCSPPYIQAFTGLSTTSQALGALSDGTYSACVVAVDVAGNTVTATNSAYTFVVATAPSAGTPNPLGAYSITGPSSHTNDTTPTVAWQPSVGATQYDMIIGADPDCAIVVDSDLDGVTTARSVGTALAHGVTYYVCIVAEDGTNTRPAANDGLAFTIDTVAPAAFTVIGPATPVNSATPQVSWNGANGAASYRLTVDSDAACAVPHLQVYDGLTATSQALAGLGDATYYVCVTARDAAGNSTAATNDGYAFVIDTATPAAPTNPLGSFAITAPAAPTASTTPTITWQTSAAATKYDVVVASDSACAGALRTFADVAALTQVVTPALPANATYFACVTAKDNGTNVRAATNHGLAFAIDTSAPGAFSITGPVTPSATSMPQVNWGSATGATFYDLVVDDAAACTAPYVQAYPSLSGTNQGLSVLGDGSYYACVVARDLAGNTTTASNSAYNFVVNTAAGGGATNPIAPFAVTGPTSSVSSLTPTVTWTAAPGATQYDLIVSTNPACSTSVESQANETTLSRTLTTTLTNGVTYYVCITAEDALANTRLASNNGYSFRVDTTQPGAFSITGPASPINSASPQVSWGVSADATTYDLIVDSEGTCASPFVQSYQDIGSTSQALGPLGDGTYYVCVSSADAAGNTRVAANNAYSFTVDTAAPPGASNPLGAFSITAPASPAGSASPILRWSASSAATKYDVVLASNASCATSVETALDVAALSHTVAATLTDGTTYYVCVTAEDNGANARAASNSSYSFTVDLTAPGAFTVTGPVSPNGSSTPQVSWAASSGAATYRVLVDTENTCTAPYVQSYVGVVGTSQTLSTLGLGTYYLCIRATDAAGLSTDASNNGYTLVIDTQAPNQAAAPTSRTGSAATIPTLQFDWLDPGDNGPTTVASYNFKVGTSPGGTNLFAGNVGNVLTRVVTGSSVAATYYASVQAVDEAGNLSPWSYSSDAVTVIAVDSTPPPALTAFTATTATRQHRSISLGVTFPASVTDYASVQVRRLAGGTLPAAACNDGTVVKTLTSFADVTLVDDIGATGTFSYRACVFDASGNLTTNGAMTATSIAASDLNHTAFASSGTFAGDMSASYQTRVFGSGLEGADYRCQYLANQVVALQGFTWKAMLSDADFDLKDRIFVWKTVQNRNPTPGTVASSETDMFDNTLGVAIAYNENEVLLGAADIWTGSTGAGLASAATCTNWSSAVGTGANGRANVASVGWIANGSNNCAVAYPIYCINQAPPLLERFTLTSVSSTLRHFDLEYTANHTHSRYATLTIRELAGSTAPKSDCSDGTVVKTITPPFTDQILTHTPGSGTVSYRACAYDQSAELVDSWVPIAGTAPASTQRRLFVTSERYNGFLGGIATADAKCQYLADNASLGNSWKAVVSTATEEARSRLAIPGRVVDTLGLELAGNADDLWDGTIARVAEHDESGTAIGACDGVWTGTESNGTLSGSGCFDASNTAWMSASGTVSGSIGSTCSTSDWVSSGTRSCGLAARLFCLEQAVSPSTALPDKRIFVSSESYTGHMLGVDGADARCQYLAEAATLTGTWKALLSTSTEDARSRFAFAKVVNMLGQTIATSPADFWDGTLTNRIRYNEDGASVTDDVWTGTSSNGTADSGNLCVNAAGEAWSATTGNGGYGASNSSSTDGIDVGVAIACSNSQRIYCLEQ